MADRFPLVVPVQQEIPADSVGDIAGAIRRELAAIGLSRRVKPGMKVAITAGSRGFPYNVTAIRTIADELKKLGAAPFVIPAMGSHGGATAEGQRQMAEGLGVTEAGVGCPIVSSMETVQTGVTPSGVPVYCDRHAYEADGIILFNRVKPHTAFRGKVESGLCKIATVGLGKQVGAEALHKAGLGQTIIEAVRVNLAKAPIIGGIATVENYREEPAVIKGLAADELIEGEAALLQVAWRYFPRLPFDDLDVLVVNRMGKEISGTGMDVNVIGMHRRVGGTGKPDLRTIVCLDLTDGSHGNALGVGFADLVPQRLVDKIDRATTYANVLTTGFYGTGKIPVTLPTPADCVRAAMQPFDPDTVRLVRVRDTKHLDRLWVSPALLPSVEANPRLKVLGPAEPLVVED